MTWVNDKTARSLNILIDGMKTPEDCDNIIERFECQKRVLKILTVLSPTKARSLGYVCDHTGIKPSIADQLLHALQDERRVSRHVEHGYDCWKLEIDIL
jgi:hypothetical protein